MKSSYCPSDGQSSCSPPIRPHCTPFPVRSYRKGGEASRLCCAAAFTTSVVPSQKIAGNGHHGDGAVVEATARTASCVRYSFKTLGGGVRRPVSARRFGVLGRLRSSFDGDFEAQRRRVNDHNFDRGRVSKLSGPLLFTKLELS